MCLGMFLFGLILYRTLGFLDLDDCFLLQVSEFFSYYVLKYVLSSFLSSPSGTYIIQILVHLMLSQRSLKLSSFLFILFSVQLE